MQIIKLIVASLLASYFKLICIEIDNHKIDKIDNHKIVLKIKELKIDNHKITNMSKLTPKNNGTERKQLKT
jgi:UDP-glucose 6-dehydrogenase